VLEPRRIERALDRALQMLDEGGARSRRDTLERQLAIVDAELANLAESAARGGAVPVVLAALAKRDGDRRRLRAELSACEAQEPVRPDQAALKTQLRGFLGHWEGLLRQNVAEARPLLDLALTGRIAFQPPKS
jgi:hypothetical protein